MILKTEIQEIINSQSDGPSREKAEHFLHSEKVHISTLNDGFIKGRVDEIAVELMLKTNSLELQSNCGCLKKNNQLCIHGLSFLMHLSDHLKSSRPPKGAKYWREMVKQMAPQDLSKLVMDFARRNKTFAMELQALNVGNPGDQDPVALAEELLLQIKEPIIKSVKKPSSTHVRLTVSTCKALLRSARQLIQGDFPIEGNKILVKTMETLHYLAHKRATMDATSKKIILACQDEIIDILRDIRAPQENENLFNLLLNMLGKSYFIPVDEDFIPALFRPFKLQNQRSQVLEIIERQIHETEALDQYQWLKIWAACMTLPEVDNVTSNYAPSPAQNLLLWKIVVALNPSTINESLKRILFSNVPSSLSTSAFLLATSNGFWSNAVDILSQYEVNFDQIDHETANALLAHIKTTEKETLAPHYLALLEISQNLQEISEYVKDKNDLEVTVEIVHLNTIKNNFICPDFLKKQIDEFLIHHIGPASRKVVFKLLDGLKSSRNIQLHNDVKDYLRNKYGIENEISLDRLTGLLQP